MPAPAALNRKDRRIFKMQVKSFEQRKNAAGLEVGVIEGYGSVFGNLDYYNDIIKLGAFAKTITEKAAFPILADHDSDRPIGMTTSLKEDHHGLSMVAEINLEVQDGREKYSLLKQGAINGLSIGFQILKEEVDKAANIRTITEIRLWEISVVTFPANPAAEVTDVRNISDSHVMAQLSLDRAKAGMKDISRALAAGVHLKDQTETLTALDKVTDDLLALRAALEKDAPAIEPTEEPLDEHSLAAGLRELVELSKL